MLDGAAQTSEALRALLEGAPAGVLRLDRELRCTWANRLAEAQLARPQGGLEGAALEELVGAEALAELRARQSCRLRALQLELKLSADADGHLLWLSRAAGEPAVRGAPDASAESQREKHLRQQAMVRFGQLALSGSELPTLFDAVTETLARLLEVELGAFVEVTADGQLQVRSTVGWRGRASSMHAAPGEDAAQATLALRLGQPVVSQDLAAETRFVRSPWLDAEGVKSSVMVPVGAHGAAAGVLAAHSRRTHAFSSSDVEFMQSLANLLALAIDNARKAEALERSEGPYRTMVESSPDAMFAHRDGKVVYANRAFAEQFGFSSVQEALGAPILSFVPPEHHAEVLARVASASRGPEPTPAKAQPVMRRDGTVRWMEMRGMRVELEAGPAVMVAARDVSERRQTDEALRRSERELEALIEQAPDAVYVHRDGICVYANAALAAVLRRPREELVGESVFTWLPAEEQESSARRVREAMTRGWTEAPRLSHMRRRDGEWATLELNAVRVQYGGEPALVVLGRDLTERMALEQQLIVSDRMATLGTLAAGVAHEINNPLAFISSNLAFVTQEVRSDAPDRAEIAQALAETADGVDRVRRIVRDLKSFARPDESPSDGSVEEAVESAAKMAQHELRHRAVLERALQPVPRVRLNESKLAQVVLNLLVNASQAMRAGAATPGTIRLRTFTDGEGRAVIEVEDDGAGIPLEAQAHVFDPFFTTKPVGVGTGLGLSICHGMVVGAGGEISFTSAPGQGTTFRIVLPPAVSPRAARASTAARERPTARKRILVIDDEQLICSAVSRSLGVRHEVVALDDAARALELHDVASRFDLVLCDVMMPSLGGPELVRRLRERGVDAERLVLMSGGVSEEVRASCAELGVRWLDKPFAIDALEALLAGQVARGSAA